MTSGTSCERCGTELRFLSPEDYVSVRDRVEEWFEANFAARLPGSEILRTREDINEVILELHALHQAACPGLRAVRLNASTGANDRLTNSLDDLTPAEREVADLAYEGITSDRAVACKLGISPRAAKARMDRLRMKLSAATRSHLTAILRGLVERGSPPPLTDTLPEHDPPMCPNRQSKRT